MSTFRSIPTAAAVMISTALLGNAAGCSSELTTEEAEHVDGADHALTAAQCDYFDVNGTIQICHALGNGKFKILKLNEQACVNAHGDHATDYVTSTDPSSPLYDPTCNGQGCLPEGAPCDATIEACEGLICADGVVQPAEPDILSFSFGAGNMAVDKVTYGLDNATTGPDGSNDGVADLVVRGNVKAIIVDFTYADGSCFPAGIWDTIVGTTPFPNCWGQTALGQHTYGLGVSLDGGATMINAATGEMPNLGWGTRTYQLYLPSPNVQMYVRARVIFDDDSELRSDEVIVPAGCQIYGCPATNECLPTSTCEANGGCNIVSAPDFSACHDGVGVCYQGFCYYY